MPAAVPATTARAISNHRGAQPAAGSLPMLRHCEGEKEQDKRGRNAIVQPALDVECPADAHRHPRVVEDRQAQRGVGGRKHRPQQTGKGQPLLWQQQQGHARPAHDGEQQANGEQPGRQDSIIAHLIELERRGIGKEQERQGEFRQRLHGFGSGRDGQQACAPRAEEEAGYDENHGHGDRPPPQFHRERGIENDNDG